MNRIDTLYRWLTGDVSPESNRILAAALEHAEPEYAARIVGILLDRRHESACAGLVANYDRLTPEARHKLSSRPELLRAGIAAAMRLPAARARENALTLLTEQPVPRLSYLVAEALRDASVRVADAAASALRRAALSLLLNPSADPAVAVAERTEFIKSLREALRTFERHGRADILEVCLWFAADLGKDLWEALADPRTRCGYVIEQHLKHWNHPRLASFLLLALAQPSWRKAATKLLTIWNERDHLIAIVRQTRLLSDPQIRHSLQHVQQPRWFLGVDPSLGDLPPDVRGRLPYWVCYLGFSNEERLRCLERWQASPLPEVHRAAVYALTRLDTREAVDVLAQVAARPCAMMQFAKWYMAGRRALAEAEGAAVERRAAHAWSPAALSTEVAS